MVMALLWRCAERCRIPQRLEPGVESPQPVSRSTSDVGYVGFLRRARDDGDEAMTRIPFVADEAELEGVIRQVIDERSPMAALLTALRTANLNPRAAGCLPGMRPESVEGRFDKLSAHTPS
jgi:hypothetical protein